MKFCTNCGYKMTDDANFCPKCGTKQNSLEPEKTSPSIDESKGNTAVSSDEGQLQSELSANVDRGSTTKNLVGMASKDVPFGPLANENTVAQEKVRLGYSNDVNNFVFAATPINWSDMVTISGLTGMKSQNYILSFEKSGLLLMGCDGLVKFNGDNHFIKNEDVEKIDLEKYLSDWDHMYLQIDGDSVELLIQHPTLSLIKWHRRNFKNVLMYTM